MITNSDEYTAMLQEIQNNNKTNIQALTVMSNEGRFIINADERTISIPPEFQNFLAVQHDHNAETVFFEIDRYFDGVDLSTKTCVIQFVNAKQESGVYPVTSMDIATAENKIIFEWRLQNILTQYEGNIKFAVKFFSIENEEYTYNWNSKIYTSSIIKGLNQDSEGSSENVSVLDNIITRLEAVENTNENLSPATEEDYIFFDI